MPRTHDHRPHSLAERFPPSPPCGCPICLGFCRRPGWWTVDEAARALRSGLGPRMMLELAPERTFAVLSPAFLGNEGAFALAAFEGRGCTFLHAGQCELHGGPFQPLECRFCHHDRPGQGPVCHAALEADWHTPTGQDLVVLWCRRAGLYECFREWMRPHRSKRI